MTSLITSTAEKEIRKIIYEAKEKGHKHLHINSLSFTEFPDEITILAKTLKKITIEDCFKLNNIEKLSSLINLESLSIIRSNKIQSYDALKELPNIKYLKIDGESISNLTDCLNQCAELSELSLSNSITLNSIAQIKSLSKLTKIYLYDCSKLEDISCIDKLKSLEEISIINCDEISNLEILNTLPNIKKIHYEIRSNSHIKVESIGLLKNLTSLRITSFNVKNLDFIKKSTSLKVLKITDCLNLVDIGAIKKFQELEELAIEDCPKIEGLESIWNLTKLKELDIDLLSDSQSFDFAPLADLTSLKSLYLRAQSKSNLSAIGKLKNLQSLELYFNDFLDITFLNSLKNLNHLTAQFPLNNESIHIIEGLENLRELDLRHIYNAQENFSLNVEKLKKLQYLSFNGKIKNLRSLNELRSLIISDEDSFDDLYYLPNLYFLNISECDSIENFESIGSLPLVERIDIDRCKNFTSTLGISSFQNLEEFLAFECDNLEYLLEFEKLKNIKKIFSYDFQHPYKKWSGKQPRPSFFIALISGFVLVC